jgi:two-component system, chemotaxis family, protein-glutamate methylesterase/glutaminase
MPPGKLPNALGRYSRLSVQNALDGALLGPGIAYVARPLVSILQVELGRTRLTSGPAENRRRPSLDPLFRSAAQVYGPAAVGTILSGYLNDGAAGLSRIKNAGGLVIIQDPEDAAVGDMPRNAAERVKPDFYVSIREMAPILLELAAKPVDVSVATSMGRLSRGSKTSSTAQSAQDLLVTTNLTRSMR